MSMERWHTDPNRYLLPDLLFPHGIVVPARVMRVARWGYYASVNALLEPLNNAVGDIRGTWKIHAKFAVHDAAEELSLLDTKALFYTLTGPGSSAEGYDYLHVLDLAAAKQVGYVGQLLAASMEAGLSLGEAWAEAALYPHPQRGVSTKHFFAWDTQVLNSRQKAPQPPSAIPGMVQSSAFLSCVDNPDRPSCF